jgi:predicted ATPase/class 3 adenylate cyclase
MHNLTPPLILERLQAGETSGRFPAVVLFVDTSGFTPLTVQLTEHERAGAEVLANILLAVFAPLVERVYAYGGLVGGFAGDAFKAIFPGAEEEVYLRALAAAHSIRQRMADQPRQETPYGVFDFTVRTSMADGEVTWSIWSGAPDGAAQSHAYTFAGPAVDDAVQGEQFADAGGLVITRPIHERLSAALPAALAVTPVAANEEYRKLHILDTTLLPAPGSVAQPDDPPLEVAGAFYPADLLNLAAQGEFRYVVSLFLNVQTLPEPDSPAPLMPALFRLLHQYGGYLCRVGRIGARDEGGTFLIFWGAPTSHENDVVRALNFLLDLRAQISTPLRAGITFQRSYAGFVGSPLREEYTCYGSGVNLAARQMVAAGWGDIWLDAETARRAAGFDVVLAGQMRFKGFASEQPVFALRERGEQASADHSSNLVGRDAELAQLLAVLQPATQEQRADLVVLVGEAGIGKSRLLHEARRRLTQPDTTISAATQPVVQWLHCPIDEILRQPLNPFRYALRTYFSQSPAQTERENKARFDQRLGALIAQTADPALQQELARTRSFLGALVDLFWEDSLYGQVAPQLRFENTFSGLRALLLAESHRQPLVVEIEDLQWIDVESHQFLQRLLAGIAEHPLQVVATSREDPATDRLGENVRIHLLPLAALSSAAVARLAEERLGQPVTSALVELVQSRSEGNPFFAEQLLLYLQEQNLLVASATGLAPTATELLPDAVQALLVARLDQLAQTVKEVVQTASVLGREFEVEVLSRMLRNTPTVLTSLHVAEDEAIWTALSELRYLFRHTLLREAAYEMQLRARLRTLHQLAAECIEQVYAADLAPHYADLAYHYGQALAPDQERRFARLAGERAAGQFANADAVRFFTRALELTPADDHAARYDLLAARVRLLQTQGERTAERADVEAMVALAAALADPIRQARAALAAAEYAEATSDFPAAVAAARRALDYAIAGGDDCLQANAYEHLARKFWRLGQYSAALAQAEEAYALARTHGFREEEANARVTLGITRWYMGDYPAAAQQFEQSLPIYEEIGKRFGQAPVLNNLGLIAQNLGDHPAALRYLDAALAIYHETGDRLRQGIGRTNAGISYQRLGQYERALEYQHQALAIFSELGDRFGMMVVQGNLGAIAIDLGDDEVARTHISASLELARAIGSRGYDSLPMAMLAEIDIRQGSGEEAYERLRAALEIARKVGYRENESKILSKFGRAALTLGRLEEAAAAYEAALAIRIELQQPTQQMEARAGLADVALAQGDPVRALGQVEPILAFLETGSLEGVLDPFEIYLTLYETLRANGDDRADGVLATAHSQLQQRAGQIGDQAMRRAYLEKVSSHRRLVETFASAFSG